jgi:hypothetical protein
MNLPNHASFVFKDVDDLLLTLLDAAASPALQALLARPEIRT